MLLKEKYFFDLKVENEDKDLINVSNIFLKDLNKQFEHFKKDYFEKKDEWDKYLKKENFSFYPERLLKQSPLTIINAPWGTGKTHFIENIIKLIIDEKIESKVFKKIIIIDAWKFSSSNNVPFEFMEELFNKIYPLKFNKLNSEKIKKPLLKMFLKAICPNNFSINFGATTLNWEIQKNLENTSVKIEEEKIKKNYNKIKNNNEPILIFIDNLERLGSYSWDLLKSILKLQEFSNYQIVLPLNLNKIKNNENNENNEKKYEYSIEKYVSFHIYNFKQDYKRFLKNYFNKKEVKNDNLIDNLNKIFNFEIQGEKLTIRQIENLFNSLNELKQKNEYQIYKEIFKKIWSPTEIIEKIFLENINFIIENEEAKRKIYEKLKNIVIAKDQNSNYINIEKRCDFIEMIPQDLVYECFYYVYFKNYNNIFLKTTKLIQKKMKRLERENEEKNKKTIEINKKIETKEKTILTNNWKIEKLNKEIKEEKAKQSEDMDSPKMTNIKLCIKETNEIIKKAEEEIKELIKIISKIQNEKQNNQNILINMNSINEILGLKQEYNAIEKKINLNKDIFEYCKRFISEFIEYDMDINSNKRKIEKNILNILNFIN